MPCFTPEIKILPWARIRNHRLFQLTIIKLRETQGSVVEYFEARGLVLALMFTEKEICCFKHSCAVLFWHAANTVLEGLKVLFLWQVYTFYKRFHNCRQGWGGFSARALTRVNLIVPFFVHCCIFRSLLHFSLIALFSAHVCFIFCSFFCSISHSVWLHFLLVFCQESY